MKFGLFYEHQVPRPWTPNSDWQVFHDALDQIALADQLGYDHVWMVEHHFLEEYSHCSAPEVFLGALSQRTENIRIGHGICHMLPNVNHPARVAERIGTLDILSGGRMEWGTGEGTTIMELEGFNLPFEEKNAAWREATEQAVKMTVMEPYDGFKGKYFSMPPRNVVPKPMQKPHPPLWLACSRNESIERAARLGMGALVFGFSQPELASEWVKLYYDTLRSEKCVPMGYAVNPNIAVVAGLSVHKDEQEAIRRGLDGFKFFGYSLGQYTSFGTHQPGVSQLWETFETVKDAIPDKHRQGSIGTPAQARAHCQAYADAGVDQIIFVLQTGKVKHEHICESLKLFADEVMPAFKVDEAKKLEQKADDLQPYVAAALARKGAPPVMAREDIPKVVSHGVLQKQKEVVATGINNNQRGGGISFLQEDPAKAKEKAKSAGS